MAAYYPGDQVHLVARAVNEATGQPQNATTMSFEIQTPDGAATTVTPANSQTGFYDYLYTIPEGMVSGEAQWGAIATGAVAKSEYSAFQILAAPF